MPKENRLVRDRYLRRLIVALIAILGLVFGMMGRYLFDQSDLPQKPDNHLTTAAPGVTPDPGKPPVLTMSADRLVSRFISAVSNLEPTDEVYRTIPTLQMGGLSFEQFQRYVNLYRKILRNNPTAFIPMSTSERDRIIIEMLENDPALAEIAENSRYFWLEAETEGGEADSPRFPFAVQTRADGLVYFSMEWTLASLDLYDYTQTYLHAIDSDDEVILSGLLSSRSNNPEIRQAKARLTLDYYGSRSDLVREQSRVLSLRMDELELEIDVPGTAGDSHVIEVRRDADGIIDIIDRVPMPVGSEEILPQGETLKPQQQVSTSELASPTGTLYWAYDPVAGLIVSEAYKQISMQPLIARETETLETLALREGQWLLVRTAGNEYLISDISADETAPNIVHGTLQLQRWSVVDRQLLSGLGTGVSYDRWLLRFPMLDLYQWRMTAVDLPLTLSLTPPLQETNLSEAKPDLLQLSGTAEEGTADIPVEFLISESSFNVILDSFRDETSEGLPFPPQKDGAFRSDRRDTPQTESQ